MATRRPREPARPSALPLQPRGRVRACSDPDNKGSNAARHTIANRRPGQRRPVEASQTTESDLMNPQLNYLIAKQRMADLTRSAEQERLSRLARTVEPNDARLGRRRLLARLRTIVASSATAAPVEDRRGAS